ncbi:mCG128740 [Mus musculus]|nr:mCG128740 [Mus musculus]
MNYDTAEVDILGVDGVLYKGRMSSQFGTRTGEKDIAAVKVSYYTIPNLTDRVRPGSLLAPGYPPLSPRTSITSATTLHSATNTTTARPPSLPPVPQLPPLIPVSRDTQEAPGSAKRLKSPRL